MTLNGVMAVILRYFSEFWYLPERTVNKFTFDISSPDEFLYILGKLSVCFLSWFISEREPTFTFAVRCMLSPVRLSVVCNTRAPYSSG